MAHAPLHRVGVAMSWGQVLHPWTTVASVWSHRELLAQFTRREVLARHRGSLLGIVWTLLNPLLLLAMYTLVFTVVFEARWGVGDAAGAGGRAEFVVALFAGLVVFEVFSSTVNSSPLLVVNNPNFVKKVVFPLEVLPLATLLAGVVLMVPGLAVLLAGNLLLRGGVSSTLWLLPVVLAPLVLIAGGLALGLSALGVFLRDIRAMVVIGVQVLFFTTPILYPASRLERAPEWIQSVLTLNPLAPIFESVRAVLVFGQQPQWAGLAVATLVGLVVFHLGHAAFVKGKRGFADVL